MALNRQRLSLAGHCLNWHGRGLPLVPEVFVQDTICERLLPPLHTVLHRSSRMRMLYGYSRERAFRGQDAAHVQGQALVDDDDMAYPFMLIELTNKADAA